MKRTRYPHLFQYLTTLIVTLAVSLTFGLQAMPVWGQNSRNVIAYRMLDLQQSQNRWIEIDLKRQRLIAWEGNKAVYAVIVSTGKASTPTRLGTFTVQTKHQVTRMMGPGYDVPDVPYTM